MATNQPRISTYISRRDHARLTARLEDRGLSMAEYLRRLVEADLDGHHDYMLRLLGHRMSLMSVQVGALARREFDDAEYQRLRSMAVTMGASTFGPLPPRPYDFEQSDLADERVEALHALFDTV